MKLLFWHANAHQCVMVKQGHTLHWSCFGCRYARSSGRCLEHLLFCNSSNQPCITLLQILALACNLSCSNSIHAPLCLSSAEVQILFMTNSYSGVHGPMPLKLHPVRQLDCIYRPGHTYVYGFPALLKVSQLGCDDQSIHVQDLQPVYHQALESAKPGLVFLLSECTSLDVLCFVTHVHQWTWLLVVVQGQ